MHRLKPVLVVSALLVLAACTAHQATTPVAPVDPAGPGFLLGLWHGFIFPVAWFLSLVIHDINIYAVPNNGGWYNFGYFLGIVVFGVGANRGQKVIVREKVVEKRGPVIEHE